MVFKLRNEDTHSEITVSSTSTTRSVNAKKERAIIRKKTVSSSKVAVALNDVWGRCGKWSGVEELIKYFRNKKRAVLGVMTEDLEKHIPSGLRDAMCDLVVVPPDCYYEGLLRFALQDDDEILPFLMNGDADGEPGAKLLLRARPDLQVKFTFSANGRFQPLGRLEEFISNTPDISECGSLISDDSVPQSSCGRKIKPAPPPQLAPLSAACPGQLQPSSLPAIQPEAKHGQWLIRRVNFNYDAKEVTMDGRPDAGYLKVEQGDVVKFGLYSLSPANACNQYQGNYIYAYHRENPDEGGWLPEAAVSIAEKVVVRNIEDCAHRLGELESTVSSIEQNLTSCPIGPGKIRDDLCKLETEFNKVSDEIDSLELSGLEIDRGEARARRKQLASQANSLHEKFDLLLQGVAPTDIRQPTCSQVPLLKLHPQHLRSVPLEEYDIASSAGDELCEDPEGLDFPDWRRYDGKWWQVCSDGIWRATDGETWKRAGAQGSRDADFTRKFHVPHLGFSSSVKEHLRDLKEKLRRHGLDLLNQRFMKRPMCDLPQIMEESVPEDEAIPEDCAPWYLLWAEVRGSFQMLEALRSGDISVYLDQPDGEPLLLKFKDFQESHKLPGPRKVAMPRVIGIADDRSTSSCEESSSCKIASARQRELQASAAQSSMASLAQLPGASQPQTQSTQHMQSLGVAGSCTTQPAQPFQQSGSERALRSRSALSTASSVISATSLQRC